MIGLALVTLVAVLAAGITSTFRGAVEDLWTDADYAMTAQNNFSPIPASVGEGIAEVPGVEAVGDVRTGDAQVFGNAVLRDRRRPARSARCSTSTWAEGSEDVLARARRRRRGRRRRLRRRPRPAARLAGPADVRERRPGDRSRSRASSTRPRAARPSARSRSPPPSGTSTTRTRATSSPSCAWRAVRPTRTRPRSSRRSPTFPNAKAQTRSEFIDNQIAGLSAILNILYVLLALSVVVSPLRDRQHARADGVRAHARDRDAARDRHDAAAGAADDPPRERDHRADRRLARDHSRHRPRRAARGANRLHRLHAAGRLADRVRDRDDRRRDHRRRSSRRGERRG